MPDESSASNSEAGISLIRVELIALSCALLCFIPVFIPGTFSITRFVAGESLITLAALSISTVLASALIGAFTDWTVLPESLIKATAARIGVRVGGLVVLLGGGILIIASFFSDRKIEILEYPSAHPVITAIATFLSAIPVMFFGSLSCLLVASLPFLLAGQSSDSIDDSTPVMKRKSQKSMVPYAIAFALLCLLAAFFFPSPFERHRAEQQAQEEREARRKAEAEAIANRPIEQQPAEDEDKPEPEPLEDFTYTRPSSLDMASPGRWQVSHRKQLRGDYSGWLMTISPDSRLLALWPSEADSGELIVYDINHLKVVARFTLGRTPEYVTWSPGVTHLLTAGKEGDLSVLVLATGAELDLPVSKTAYIPTGRPHWWFGSEVLFHDGDRFTEWLDTRSLKINAVETSSRWKQQLATKPDEPVLLPEESMPNTTRSRFAVVPQVTDYISPRYRQLEWSIEWAPRFAMEGRLRSGLKTFSEISMESGDRFVLAPDCSKLAKSRDGRIEIFYFESLPEEPPLTFEVQLPTRSDRLADEVAEQIDRGEICFFICSPLANPLSGDTIGPDREAVKAVARLLSWEEDKGVIWIAEQYQSIEESDIAADAHIWLAGNPESAIWPVNPDWWSALQPADEEAPENVAPLDQSYALSISPARGAFEFHSMTFPLILEPEPEKGSADSGNVSISALSNPQPARPPVQERTPEQIIAAFLHRHLQEYSARNVAAIIDNYVDIRDRSASDPVTRRMIQEQLSAPTRRWADRYVMTGRLTIGRMPHEQRKYKAMYQVAIIQGNRYSKQFFETYLIMSSDGPLIYSEKGTFIPHDR